MTAAFATGGHATPIVTGQGVSPLAGPKEGRSPGDALRKHTADVASRASGLSGPSRTIAAADAIMRAAGAVTTGEA